MNISEKLKKFSLEQAQEAMVQDVCIGLGYTGVLLNTGNMGVAFTFHEHLKGGCGVFKGLRPLAGRKASELLTLFDSEEKVESGVALATCNGLSNITNKEYLKGDILDHLRLTPSDRVAMVGYFAPLVPLLKKAGVSLKIFEQSERTGLDLLPEDEVYEHLSRSEVALVTSTSIINQTIDPILDAAQACREVVLLGASTPLVPEAFSDTPVTILSGVVVTETKGMMGVVREGGGTRTFRRHVDKVNILMG